jgi:plasmid stability protein
MSQLNINLPEDVAKRLRERAAREGHETVEAFVEALLKVEAEGTDADLGAPAHLSVRADADLEVYLESRMRGDDGGTIEATPEFWDELKRQSDARRRRTLP